ncbi:MAG: hypothetical protein JRI64_07555 [Deltaproteobacteria bacterium]|nr:hypothetical protein [Deltaproteobacteria bacterium]
MPSVIMMVKSCKKIYPKININVRASVFSCDPVSFCRSPAWCRMRSRFKCGKQRLNADRLRAMPKISGMGFEGHGATATLCEKSD